MRYFEVIYDVNTGESVERDFTDAEIKARLKQEKEDLARLAEIQAKEQVRISALEKLKSLGLTEDEIAAL